jgi:hypothetical protein
MQKALLPLLLVLEQLRREYDPLKVPVHVLGLVIWEPVALVILGLHQVLDLLLLVLIQLRVVSLIDVLLLALDGLESEVPVPREEPLLLLLPESAEPLDGCEDEPALLICELAVLPQRVQADHVLLLLHYVGLLFKFLPLLLLTLKG